MGEILKKHGRSQAFLSRELNRSVNTINNWCKNSTQFNLLEAKRIAEILHCKTEGLIEDDNKQKIN
ncbi:MAG: helix-turn-helix transcriptional regulator [Flavobacteriia bacterium]|nr:helix-turn-helix transcriptional regulator [Flavobacteriia bacterium]